MGLTVTLTGSNGRRTVNYSPYSSDSETIRHCPCCPRSRNYYRRQSTPPPPGRRRRRRRSRTSLGSSTSSVSPPPAPRRRTLGRGRRRRRTSSPKERDRRQSPESQDSSPPRRTVSRDPNIVQGSDGIPSPTSSPGSSSSSRNQAPRRLRRLPPVTVSASIPTDWLFS